VEDPLQNREQHNLMRRRTAPRARSRNETRFVRKPSRKRTRSRCWTAHEDSDPCRHCVLRLMAIHWNG
jgi:hypothetical protein